VEEITIANVEQPRDFSRKMEKHDEKRDEHALSETHRARVDGNHQGAFR
jgi:hypothetical protein